MTTAYKGPFPNVAVTISVQVDSGPVITKTVNLPNTDVFNVTQQATLTQAPTDLRTAQRSLTFAEDPRLEVREVDYPGYTVAIIERAIQQESGTDNWLTLDPTAVSSVGAKVRFRSRAQVYDETGAAYEPPVDLYSAPQTVVAHVAPGAMAAGSITFAATNESPSGTEAQATIVSYPTAGTASVVGFDYSLDAGSTMAGTVLKSVGITVVLTLAANTPNQIVHVRARDADGGTSTSWTQLTQTVSTSTGAETLTIIPTRTTGTAPAGVYYTTEATGFEVEDPYHDIYYRWNFGDPGHYTRHDTDDFPWDRVYDVDGVRRIVRGSHVYAEDGATLIETKATAPAVPTGTSVTYLGPNKNVAEGPHVNHAFETPGSYTITCQATTRARIEAGLPWITATAPMTAAHWNTKIAASRVFCLRDPSIPAGTEPVGAQVFTDYLTMLVAYRASSQSTAILFRRGGNYDTSPKVSNNWGNNKPALIYVGAYGPTSDADPILNRQPTIDNTATSTSEVIYHGIAIDGGFRSTDPYSVTTKPTANLDIEDRGEAHTTVWDCEIYGMGECIFVSNNAQNVIIGNNYFHDWWNYGIYLGDSCKKIGMNGYFGKQPKGTKTGQGKQETTQPFFADHGPWRTSLAGGEISFHMCDHRSLNSWSGDFNAPLRLGGSGVNDVALRTKANTNRVRGEMGPVVSGYNYDQNNPEMPRKMIADKIYVADANTAGKGSCMTFSVAGYTVRNAVWTVMNTPPFGSRPRYWIKKQAHPVASPINYEYGYRFYNITFVDMRTDLNGSDAMEIDYEGFAPYAYFTVENVITHRPNRSTPETPFAPLDHTVLYAVDYDGFNYELNPTDTSFAINPAEAALVFAPLTGSPALGTATGRIAVDDFWGNIRPAVGASQGAMEPY